MSEKRGLAARRLLSVLAASAVCSVAFAKTIYVNGACGNDAWSGSNGGCAAPDGPKQTLAAAISAAVNGDIVLVADGTYSGPGNSNLNFSGKAITLRSESGNRAACVVDLQDAGRFATYAATDSATVQSITIRNGNAVNSGGAAFLNSGSSPTFIDVAFESNFAPIYGGGLAAFNATVTLDGCAFNANQAQRGGGAYISGGTLTVSGCSFTDNFANIAAGGGLRVLGGCLLICTDSSFSANKAWVGGAGLFVNSIDPSSKVTGCVFKNNEAGLSGDGAGGGYASEPGPGVGEISDCVFEGNLAVAAAGILFRGDATTKLERVLFLNNHAVWPAFASDGGAVRAEQTTSPQFVSCQFIGNTAAYGGGVESWGTASFVNCLFAGNKATGLLEDHPAGGALDLFLASAATVATNCTFVGNSADEFGGAITIAAETSPAHLQLDNCVLWGNSAPIGPEIRIGWGPLNPYGVVTVSYSDVAGGQAGVSIRSPLGTLNWGAGNLDVDPLFVDPNAGNCRLQPGSLCIDAGSNLLVPAGTLADLDGNDRFRDDLGVVNSGAPGGEGGSKIVDMGAYELQLTTGCPGDLTGDKQVNQSDLGVLLAAYGTCPGDPGYHSGAGHLAPQDPCVSQADLGVLLAVYGQACP